MEDRTETGAADALRSPAHLACIRGPDVGAVVPVLGTTEVGRDGAVRLSDPEVSRRHAVMRWRPDWRGRGRLSIRDVGSANGTSVRSRPWLPWRRVTRDRAVRVGARVRIGTDVFEVRARPTDLTWPEPLPERRGLRLLGLGLPLMAAFMVWRLSRLHPAAPWIALSVLTVAGVVAGIIRWRRGRRWRRADPALLAIAAHASAAGHHPRASRGPVPYWPGRVRRRGAWTDPPQTVGVARRRAEATARWIEVQVAVRDSDAVVTVPHAERPEDLPAACLRVLTAGLAPSDLWMRQLPPRECGGAGLPESVDAADLEQPEGARGLAVAIGRGPGGDVAVVDLIGDGPHALVAGTTGSGKSEALLTWLLAMCDRQPPKALRLILLDYKGGATFAPLAGLPHVAGLATDLDPAMTARVLAALERLITRRERELADAGFTDLPGWEAAATMGRADAAPPRFVVAIDEFRVLAEHHPEAMANLLRMVSQGRSLGIHLIAATQRPAGALTQAMRANIGLSICLRTVDARESADVRGDGRAAQLPRIPGRALIGDAEVQWARVADVGQTVRALAAHWPVSPSDPLWAPPLPEQVVAMPGRLGVCEPPGVVAHETLAWDGATLFVTGPPARTAERRAIALAAAHSRDGAVVVLDAEDPAACAWTIERPPAPGTIVVDDLDQLMESLADASSTGRAAAAWRTLLRRTRSHGHRIVVIGDTGDRAPRGFRHRLDIVESSEDRAALLLPRGSPIGGPPGRVVARGFHPAPVPAQVALKREDPPGRPRPSDRALPADGIGWADPARSLPVHVDQVEHLVVAADPVLALERLGAVGASGTALDPGRWTRLTAIDDGQPIIVLDPRGEVLAWARDGRSGPHFGIECERWSPHSGIIVRSGSVNPLWL